VPGAAYRSVAAGAVVALHAGVRRALLAIAAAAGGLGGAPACSRLPPETAPVAVSYPAFDSGRTVDEAGEPIDPYAAGAAGGGFASDTGGSGGSDRRVGGFIPTPVMLGDPRTLELLRVDLRVGDYALPSGPGYQVVRIVDGVQRVTVRPVPGAKVDRADRDAALGATTQLDVGTERLRVAAREAIAGAADARARTAALIAWVYARITYEHVEGEEIASEVLDRGTGDCSEMSILFVAMARAVGIPARRVVGLAATYDQDSFGFGFHAWAEVAIDGRWVAVDPTWNEVVADASHIPLLAGDGDEWAAAASVIEVDVVEISHTPGADSDIDPRQLARDLPVHLQLRRRARR
jgi:transglutaminase-like putative cysteine protease